MKIRSDLEPKSSIVLSSPGDYYIDPDGKVNQIEDDAERVLFGTVANPSPIVRPFNLLSEYERALIEGERHIRTAFKEGYRI